MGVLKDIETEISEDIMKAIGKMLKKDPMLCPHCKNGKLKKDVIEHYCEVAAIKLAATIASTMATQPEIGIAVPTPPYKFKCTNCKHRYTLVDGKFVPLDPIEKMLGLSSDGVARNSQNSYDKRNYEELVRKQVEDQMQQYNEEQEYAMQQYQEEQAYAMQQLEQEEDEYDE